MKRALISDIHGNLEALEAVLRDIDQQHVDEVISLGDMVGYGPNPIQCLQRLVELDVCLLGNHDEAILVDPAERFNDAALQAIRWSRGELYGENGSPLHQGDQQYVQFIESLPRSHSDGDLLFVHGSPFDPTNEYVMPSDARNLLKMRRLFEHVPWVCFQGHTHVPGVFTEDYQFLSPTILNCSYRLGDEKLMINVGSVGQPRDSDPRACYVILDDDLVSFRRIEYSWNATASKIYQIDALHDTLGHRLLQRRECPAE